VIHGIQLAPGGRAALLSPNTLEFVEIVCRLGEAWVSPALISSRSSESDVRFCDDAGAKVLFVHPTLEELARTVAPESVEHFIVIGDPTKSGSPRRHPPPGPRRKPRSGTPSASPTWVGLTRSVS
jgi:acyl-CoA synthetase (AMP-forming)/AMP-acid ligase II